VALNNEQLQEIIAELLLRPGHEKVRGLLFKLLTDGLGAKSADVSFEHQTVEIRGRIDALLGRTVIEVKSDLRKEAFETQLAGYLRDRRNVSGQDFVGIVTDGATFSVHELADDNETLLALGKTNCYPIFRAFASNLAGSRCFIGEQCANCGHLGSGSPTIPKSF
jgi:hypothetical protein